MPLNDKQIKGMSDNTLNFTKSMYVYLLDTIQDVASKLFEFEKCRIADETIPIDENSQELYVRLNLLLQDIASINEIVLKRFE